MQPRLASEARLLGRVYGAHLYGGPTLPDSVADGSKDAYDGALFRSPRHADLLFRTSGCMRQDASNCAAEGSPWYAVSQHGIDPMMRRLAEEAELLAHDNASTITPDDANSRCERGGLGVGRIDCHACFKTACGSSPTPPENTLNAALAMPPQPPPTPL